MLLASFPFYSFLALISTGSLFFLSPFSATSRRNEGWVLHSRSAVCRAHPSCVNAYGEIFAFDPNARPPSFILHSPVSFIELNHHLSKDYCHLLVSCLLYSTLVVSAMFNRISYMVVFPHLRNFIFLFCLHQHAISVGILLRVYTDTACDGHLKQSSTKEAT